MEISRSRSLWDADGDDDDSPSKLDERMRKVLIARGPNQLVVRVALGKRMCGGGSGRQQQAWRRGCDLFEYACVCMRVSRYAVTQFADDSTQWRISLKARLVFRNGREEEDKRLIRVDQAGFEEYGGLENGGWGEGNKAREQKEKRVEGVWTNGPRRAGGWGDIFGLIDWLID